MTDFLASTGQLTTALAVGAFMLMLWLLARMAPEPTALPARRRKEALAESLLFRLTLPFIQAVGVLEGAALLDHEHALAQGQELVQLAQRELRERVAAPCHRGGRAHSRRGRRPASVAMPLWAACRPHR